MSNAEIVEAMESICKKMGRTSDPIKKWELECELEYLNEQLEGAN